MKAPSALSMVCKQTEEIVMGCPLTIYVPHSVQSLLNSHHTQHFSVSRLAPYEVVLLSAPNITLIWCNSLTLQLLLLYRMKTPTVVLCLLTTFLFLGMTYRKLLLVMLT